MKIGGKIWGGIKGLFGRGRRNKEAFAKAAREAAEHAAGIAAEIMDKKIAVLVEQQTAAMAMLNERADADMAALEDRTSARLSILKESQAAQLSDSRPASNVNWTRWPPLARRNSQSLKPPSSASWKMNGSRRNSHRPEESRSGSGSAYRGQLPGT